MMTMLYMYPLLTEASISLLLSGNATLLVAFGSLDLVAGGLSLAGKPYPRAVSLKPGQSISWQHTTG